MRTIFIAVAWLIVIWVCLTTTKAPPDPVTARQELVQLGVAARSAPDEPDGSVVEIALYRKGRTATVVDCLAAFPDLEVLTLYVDDLSDRHLVRIGRLHRLKHLTLKGSPHLTGRGIAALSQLEDLQTLCLSHIDIGDEALASLSGLARLEDLWIDSPRVTDTGLIHLAPLVNLRRLSLAGTGVRGPGLSRLAGATLLQHLNLEGTPMVDLTHVGGFPGLRELILCDCALLSDASLTALAPLIDLRFLDLRNVHLSGVTLSVIARHGQLEGLALDGTGVGSAAVDALAHPGRLEMLSLLGADIAEEEALRIARAHPKLGYFQPPEGFGTESWARLRAALPRLHSAGCDTVGEYSKVADERARRARTDATTALMDAVMRRNHARLCVLLGEGAPIDERAPCDAVTGPVLPERLRADDVHPLVTPLHAACALGDECSVEHLLAAGADPTLGLDDGRSPMEAAATRGSAVVVRQLLAVMGTLPPDDACGQAALIGALEHGNLEVARILRDAGIRPHK